MQVIGSIIPSKMMNDARLPHSPKRKRTDDLLLPSLNTSGITKHLKTSNDTDTEGEQSPRTRVTGRFTKLEIDSPQDRNVTQSEGDELELQQPILPQSTSQPTALTPSRPLEQRADTKGDPMFVFTAGQTHAAVLPTPPSSRTTKSPPPGNVRSDQFWTDDEITGWDPNDPDEDFYGVNGVGYSKPAALSWSISQKRKQQIADYRSREAREARQRRSERRRTGTSTRRSPSEPVSKVVTEIGKRAARVRFDEG